MAPAANIVFNRYLADTRRIEDFDALAAMPFFLSTRAAIRAKVTAARMEGAEMHERKSIALRPAAYFEFASGRSRRPRPQFVAVGGLSGTGKSRLSRLLAPASGRCLAP